MAAAAIGTDTGGSCRIPAALCGTVGYKPTARRVSLRGVIPLSASLDSVGPITRSVSCASILDAILAGDDPRLPAPASINGLRLGILRDLVFDGVEAPVAAAFEAAIAKLDSAGAVISDAKFNDLNRLPDINAKGGFATSEAYAWHRDLLEKSGSQYDPRVSGRIEKGRDQTAVDYIKLIGERAELIKSAHEALGAYDAIVFPSVPIIAPTFDDVSGESDYTRLNMALLRNPSVANFLDRCALSDTGPTNLEPLRSAL